MSFSVTRAIVIASSLPNSDSPPPSHSSPSPPVRRIITPASNLPRKTRIKPIPQQKQPSVIEIERAIGAGMFRDRDPREREENNTLFDMVLSKSIGRTEGSVEKKLRETGEWLLDKAGDSSNSAGKQILIGMYLCIIPLGLLLLVASGVIKLPFSTPYLDDLIM